MTELFNNRDRAYSIISRLEENLRTILSDVMVSHYSDDWVTHIPKGVQHKTLDRMAELDENLDPSIISEFLEYTDFPDLKEIFISKDNFKLLFREGVEKDQVASVFDELYYIRNKIAHVRRHFTLLDLQVAIDLTIDLLDYISYDTSELKDFIKLIPENPNEGIIKVPDSFVKNDVYTKILNNLPSPDYDIDGGFIGRRADLKKIKKMLLGNLDRVITISGAGGVGKTAVALEMVNSLIASKDNPFTSIVWVSAKEDKLTLTGIEDIVPTLRTFEDILDKIISVHGFDPNELPNIQSKKEFVKSILESYRVLLVVDNLETVKDQSVIDFIKDFPHPGKVLITSRTGLGEVERRYPLRELSIPDAITLFRVIAREKGLEQLVKLSNSYIEEYVQRLNRYPLAIKWALGQISLGKDIEQAFRLSTKLIAISLVFALNIYTIFLALMLKNFCVH